MITARLHYSDYGSLLHRECGVIAVELPGGHVEVYHPDDKPTEHYRSWEAVVAATQGLLPQHLNLELRP